MPENPWEDKLTPVLWQLRIIVGALIVGCLSFMAIALLIAPGQGAPPGTPILTYAALAAAMVAVLVRLVVPGVIVSGGRRNILPGHQPGSLLPSAPADVGNQAGDAAKLWAIFQTKTIVACALLEGAAFLLLVAYMVERSPLSLLAAVLLVIGLALHIPTRQGLEEWTQEQLRLLEEERH